MEKSEGSYQPEVSRSAVPNRRTISHSFEQLHSPALESESFEEAQVALESVEALQEFRKKASMLPFGSFHEIVEETTGLNRLPLSLEERAAQTETLASALEQRAARLSPRVADLYLAILAKIKNGSYELKFDITREKIDDLKQSGDLDVLLSGKATWEIKLNRIETRLVDYLLGAKDLDRREGKEMDYDTRKWREEELKKISPLPPGRRNESKPGVDPMERLKEGERVPAMWKIEPGFSATKYFKEQSFSRWDSKRNVWVEDEYQYEDAEFLPLLTKEKEDPKRGLVNITMITTVDAGRWVSCPIPYTHGLHSVETGGRNYSVQQDQNGDTVILVEGEGEVEVKVILAAKEEQRLIAEKPKKPTIPDMPSEFTEDTNKKLAEIRNKGRGNIVKARMLAAYVRSRIKYLAPKSREEADKYNNLYNTHARGFAGAVDEVLEGDCDVVNTYFSALCAKLNISVRHAIGHSVKGRDVEGKSEINSGTGHGWSEIWDEIRSEWVLIDATPSGDPNLEDDQEKGGPTPPGFVAGDDIEQEAVRPSDEKLEELRKKLAERKEQLSYTKEERQLAEAAGVELKEARNIVKEINEAERTRLPNGELVTDTLAKLFNAIVESRRMSAFGYTGPVRQSEGGEEIEDITGHYIQAKSGEMDPRSRNLPSKEIKEEKIIGGFDVYKIADKSGSMQQTTADGERLWKMQRRAEYLILSALHRFERNVQRAGLQKENALSIRTQEISFRDSGPEDIDLEKPLSSSFTAGDKVKLWHGLTNQGSGNGDVAALSYVYEQIKKEKDKIEVAGGKDNRLRLVFACSDGGPDDSAKVQLLAEELGKLNAVVVGIGLTETAAAVPVIYNTPYSRGSIARNINDLPVIMAKHVVLEAIKLFPEKAQESARQIIESSIAKFKDFA